MCVCARTRLRCRWHGVQENKQIVLHLNDKTKYRLRFETQSMAEEWAARLKHVHIHASRTPTGEKSAPIKPPVRAVRCGVV